LTPIRAARLFAALLLSGLFAAAAGAQTPASQRPPVARPATARPAPVRLAPVRQATAGSAIQVVKIEGNQRIEEGTIRSYMLVRAGDGFDQDRVDRSLKVLFATGLFQDVRITRDGDALTVHVVENPIVNRVAFEGNHKLGDDTLKTETQLRARAVYSGTLADADRRHILDLYAKRGYYNASVEAKVIRLEQNRVDVVFQIDDGQVTLVSKIAVVGNKAFSQSRLTDVIDSREQRWWRFLSTSDQYDPERLNYDKELLRRFYLKSGYADFEVLDARAELSPDRTAFFVTYTIKEGERYRVGKVTVNSQLRNLTGDDLKAAVPMADGDWYDGDAVGKTSDKLEEAVRTRGYAFVEVKPRVSRNTSTHTIDIAYDVGQGPRVFIERIDINGNQRTMDKVVRREMRLAEGDAFNAEAIRRSRSRLTDLGYFQSVDIVNSPGSAPDKAILTVNIAEKATGELSFGGGYSTDAGALVDVGLAERNLIGTGINASINGVLAQKRSSITLSVTDPYFLDRNLVVGGDLFLIQTNNLGTQVYDERRAGFALRTGFAYTENLRQVISYSLVKRTVYNVQTTASPFITNQAGATTLSQVGSVLTLDYRDSRVSPHSGFVLEGGADFAGLGGDAKFLRGNGSVAYYIPLDRLTGNSDWAVKVAGSAGYLYTIGGKDQIIDRFFLGGDNLRGFQTGGAGPHDAVTRDPLGGRFIWTQTTELQFPLPVSADLGLNGRLFVDVGALTNATFKNAGSCIEADGTICRVNSSSAPRIGAGVGISWKTQFGLINIDLTPFVVRQAGDQTQIFRFGFGTKF
jgi:outer membrane protein insertion porin family